MVGVLLTGSVAEASHEARQVVGRSGTRFVLGGRPFFISSGNNFYLWYKPPFMTNEIVSDARQLRMNVIRLFAFCEGNSKDGFCFQPAAGQFDEATFRQLDYVVYQAGRHDVKLIIPFVNQWDDAFGGMRQYVNWVKQAYPDEIPPDLRAAWLETVNVNTLGSGTPEYVLYQRYHDLFYTNPHARQWYQGYLEQLLFRVNRYTGRMYKDDPTILMWELANEPRCESDPSGQTLAQWITDMAVFIKQRDPNHLLSTGQEGWYHDPSRSTNWRYNGSLGVDYIAHHQIPGIDACSFHLYPEGYQLSESQAVEWIHEHVADCRRLVGKPTYFGEFGVPVDRQAAPRVETLLHTFATDTEGWRVDWGYASDSPRRVSTPTVDGDGALRYEIGTPIGPGGPTHDVGGTIFTADPGLDVSQYDFLSGRLFVPLEAPADLLGDFYVGSGPDWEWSSGPQLTLAPGTWQEVALATSTMLHPQTVRKLGMRISAFNSLYDGVVFYDRIVGIKGSLQSAHEQMARRNRLYDQWRDILVRNQVDGAGVWYLSGLQENGQLDPDPSHFAVFYPEDVETDDILKRLGSELQAMSSRPLTQWEPCEAPGTGHPSSDYSDATSFTIDATRRIVGASSCQLAYQPNGFNKAYWEFSPLEENWTDRQALTLYVYAPQRLQFSVAVSTGAPWTWHESVLYPLRRGWNALRVDLHTSTWKSEATGWQNIGQIHDLNEVHRLSLGVFGYSDAGRIWIDELRLTAPPRIVGLRQRSLAIAWEGMDDRGRAPSSLRFSYRTDQAPWSPWGRKRQVGLEELDPAAEVFEVRVRDHYGSVSESRQLRLKRP